jgi:hypothetical protein
MQEVILALLELFRSCAPDAETNALVSALARDRNNWPGAHDLFNRIRGRGPLNAKDFKQGDSVRCSQYTFEELCLKSLYNETQPRDPFDPSSPFFVAEFAIQLARSIGVPEPQVLAIIAAHASPETAYYRRVFSSYPRPAGVATSVLRPAVETEEVAKEFPDLQQFPASHPGPYETNMGERIAGLIGLFQGRVPDTISNAAVLKLTLMPDRWSAGHALFDILSHRLLVAARARDLIKYLEHEFEWSCLQALYNATSPVHAFAPGSPFWVAGAAVRLASAVGTSEQAIMAVLAPIAESAIAADGGA